MARRRGGVSSPLVLRFFALKHESRPLTRQSSCAETEGIHVGLRKHAAQGRVGETGRRLPHVRPAVCVRPQVPQELGAELPPLPRGLLPQAPALRKDKEGAGEVSEYTAATELRKIAIPRFTEPVKHDFALGCVTFRLLDLSCLLHL